MERRPPILRARIGFTLVEFLVVLAIIAVLVALLAPATRMGGARHAARRAQCKNNLKQIGLALHNYHDQYQAFPPAYTVDEQGRPLHSWRVLILPFMDAKTLYDQINLTKPWNDPANAAVAAKRPSFYACPSTDIAAEQTTYLAIVGADCGLLAGQSRTLASITDGTSNTLVVIDAPQSNAVHWMSPDDANEKLLLGMNDQTEFQHTGGIHGLIADGSVRFFSQNLSDETWKGLCTATGGETLGEF